MLLFDAPIPAPPAPPPTPLPPPPHSSSLTRTGHRSQKHTPRVSQDSKPKPSLPPHKSAESPAEGVKLGARTATEKEASDPELAEASSLQVGGARPGTWPYDGACLSSPPGMPGRSEGRAAIKRRHAQISPGAQELHPHQQLATPASKPDGASALNAPQLELFAGAEQPTSKRKTSQAVTENRHEDETLARCPPAPAVSAPSSSAKMPAGARPVTLKPPAVVARASKPVAREPNAPQQQISCTLCDIVFINRNALQA